MNLTLYVRLEFMATHHLEEREEIHPHRWRMVIGVRGPKESGRVVSLPLLKELLMSQINPLKDTYLNENETLDLETRNFPTCENIAHYFFPRAQEILSSKVSPNIIVDSVEVSVEEPDGIEHGYCILKRNG